MRYGLMPIMLLLFGCAAAATQQGCGLLQRGPNGEPAPVEQIVASVAPFIPGPWGAAAAAGATALVGVGSIFAKRSVNKTFAATGSDASANPLLKIAAERKFLIPLLAAIPMIGKAFNLWDLDWNAMLATLGAAGLGVGADVYEKKATAPPTPPTP